MRVWHSEVFGICAAFSHDQQLRTGAIGREGLKEDADDKGILRRVGFPGVA